MHVPNPCPYMFRTPLTSELRFGIAFTFVETLKHQNFAYPETSEVRLGTVFTNIDHHFDPSIIGTSLPNCFQTLSMHMFGQLEHRNFALDLR